MNARSRPPMHQPRKEKRAAPDVLEHRYAAACEAKTDIHEHLPLLRELASECEHVTEMGMRWASGSTIAFLAAQPKTLVSWDIDPFAIVSQPVADLLCMSGATRFQPRVGNTLEISPIEPTDLLFIDTLHTYRQLKDELTRHIDPSDPSRMAVRRYIVFHDTWTFGMQGEDGTTPGLRTAIHWFQKHHAFPLWKLEHDRQNNNGLVVLRSIYADD